MKIPHIVKTWIRRIEARFNPSTSTVRFRNETFRFVKSRAWNETSQEWFDQEIALYFEYLGNKQLRGIVDAGGHIGMFSIVAAKLFPGAQIYVFEPAARNCTLIRRNAKLNGVSDRVHIFAYGLWNNESNLAFRTHGAISSFQAVSEIGGEYSFDETVPVRRIDEWAREQRPEHLDFVKMDIEGAEIEALEGGENTLRTFHPRICLQAYHIREGTRTFERCRDLLEKYGYRCAESADHPACLIADAT